MPAAATSRTSSPFYRKDIFEKKGYEVPTTAHEFTTLCKEITNAKARCGPAAT